MMLEDMIERLKGEKRIQWECGTLKGGNGETIPCLYTHITVA
jgi:hypothetical protein